MPNQTYTFSISADIPSGSVIADQLQREIQASAISTAIDHIDVVGDSLYLVFKNTLPAPDYTILTNDTTGPCGGILGSHIPGMPLEIPQKVTIKPVNIGGRVYDFSINFADKTTWFYEAVRVVSEHIGPGDGTTTVFSTAHPYIIDLAHGKVTDEDYAVPSGEQTGDDFYVHVFLDGVEQTEREFGEASGGDFEVNYATGQVTFYTPPGSGVDIMIDYFYSPPSAGSTYVIKPKNGKKITLNVLEIEMSPNIDMNDTICVETWIYAPAFLNLPPGTKIPYPNTLSYFKTMMDLVNWTIANSPPLSALGGPTRGISGLIQFSIQYISSVELDPQYGAELRIWLKHHREFGGDVAYVCFYGFEED